MSSAKRVYTCTVCGKDGFWDRDWGYYGTLNHEDTCPEDLIYSCSRECRMVAVKKLSSGKWKLPTLKRGVGGVSRSRQGY